MAKFAGGVVYEPRSLWSVRSMAPTEGGTRPTERFQFNREHFRNGTRWPIEIRRITLCAINYLFADDYDTTIFGRDNNSGIISRVNVSVGVPYRQRYLKRFTLSSLCPRPSAEPQPTNDSSSVLFGISRMNLDPDRPLFIPRNGTLEQALTSPQAFNLSPIDPLFSSGYTIPTEIAWFEQGGLFAGNVRSKRFNLPLARQEDAPILGGNGANNETNEGIPFGFPPVFLPSPNTETTPSPVWSSVARISGRDWDQQEAARSGSSKISSSIVGFDQLKYDTTLSFQVDGRIAPLSTRIGSKVRLLNCGSRAWWWRPGAPLALTYDTITPAIVYELPQPITLTEGDAFDVSMEIPGTGYGLQYGLPAVGAASRYTVGISFNGYAAIEG